MSRRSGAVPFRSGRASIMNHPLPLQVAQPVATAVSAAAVPAALPEMPAMLRWIVAAAIFLAISKFHGYFGILATIRAPMLLSVTALVGFFASTSSWRPSDLRKHWIPKAIGLLFLVAVGSVPFGIYQGQSITVLNEVLIRTLLIALLVWGAARTANGTLFMVRAVTLSIITATALALTIGRMDNTGRLAGGYAYDPNDIALLAVTGIPLVVWWAIDQRNKFRGPILLALPLLLQVIIQSKSRGGFIALVAVAIGFLLISAGSKAKRVRTAGRVVGLATLLAIPMFPASYLKQMETINDKDDYNRTSVTGRVEIWKRGIRYAVERPLFGVGLGNFGSAEGRSDASAARAEAGRGFKWGAAHNSFVQVLAELGFIGGGCFLLLIAGSIVQLFTMHRRGAHADLLPPFFALTILAFAASAFFLSWGYYDLTYVLVAIASAILMRGDDPHAGSESEPGLATATVRKRR